MSESLMPLPPPEPDSHHDPLPARCSEEGCRQILGSPHPASRQDSHWEGWCPTHGTVRAIYGSKEEES